MAKEPQERDFRKDLTATVESTDFPIGMLDDGTVQSVTLEEFNKQQAELRKAGEPPTLEQAASAYMQSLEDEADAAEAEAKNAGDFDVSDLDDYDDVI